MLPREVPVLIVGAGPVGMLAGILLDLRNKSCLVVERRSGPQSAPAAHVVNARSVQQADHFDMLGLQLGYVYGEGAVARDGSAPPVLASPGDYVPSAQPGARLPHAWLDGDSGRVSSLDLVRIDGFTLFSWDEHARWAEAVGAIESIPMKHVRIQLDVQAPDDGWREVCGIGPGGALLVRPDQHVAWRARSLPEAPTSSLRAALATILGSGGGPVASATTPLAIGLALFTDRRRASAVRRWAP
jgi:2,4-dichlorophenol 6-monooxygenase